MDNKRLGYVDFADDISLLESCKEKLQHDLNQVRDAADPFGLKINTNKTKSMVNTGSLFDLRCNNQTIEEIVEFKYLGSTIHNSGSCQREVKLRIGQVNTSSRKLSQIWRSQKYSLRLKLRLFNSNVFSTLCYGSETWQTDQILEKKLLAFENICLRRILNIHWLQKVTNTTIRQKTSQPLVTKVIKYRKWRYFGHVIRMSETRLP
jgi:hypothetical protein